MYSNELPKLVHKTHLDLLLQVLENCTLNLLLHYIFFRFINTVGCNSIIIISGFSIKLLQNIKNVWLLCL